MLSINEMSIKHSKRSRVIGIHISPIEV